ncbi:MAG: leucine--tRNA ligase [Clostridiales bacterium]|nr:leucine--tRNA ligase [Clostridiales bacterium]
MKEYNFSEVEKKWQNYWDEKKTYKVNNHEKDKENEYVLIEFPYPSGIGLHMGHARSYTAIDAYARKRRMMGKNVLFPFGTDAFGLEAERTAIKEHKAPQEIVERNIETFKNQVKGLGMSIDWDRSINSCDEDYYKWTQWQFIQFFKKGAVEKQDTKVNWCPNCGVLANEEVEDGNCCQCHSETVQKTKSQWVFKMTQYGERLADDLNKTEYLDHIKQSQLNWIGKSYGVEVDFKLKQGGKFSIFTTCIETIYGITFMVLAPEGKIVQELRPMIKNWEEVEKYIKETAKKSEFDRTEMNKSKSGCKLEGIQAINPVNGKEVDVYIGDFVLANYGTGAVMAVPSHDQRDFEYAISHKIPMIQVIDGRDVSECAFEKQDYLGKGCKLINSEEFTGLTVEEAKEAITEKLIKMGVARKQVNFKMRDWIFSRQRYWGEPIPMVHCDCCGWVPVDEKDLPVTLPKVVSYEPTKDGESPLSMIPEFVNTTCPKCDKPAKRETDTMPGWAGSSWYFLRYCDAHNDKEFASMDALKAWLPVGLYNGGNEHTTRHLLYARYWVKMLYDLGLSPVEEPFKKRISQGLILGADGKKMSKSAGNGVDPRLMVDKYGADSLRLWMSFIGEYSESVVWSEEGLKACNKLLNRIWNIQELVSGESETKELSYHLNAAIKKVSADIDNTKFNTAISAVMILVNEVYKVGKISRDEYKKLITIISPFAPHLASELFDAMGYGKYEEATWPSVDESALVLDEVEIPIQVNGKLRGKITVSRTASEDEIKEKAIENVKEYVASGIKKIIYIPGRIFNIVV